MSTPLIVFHLVVPRPANLTTSELKIKSVAQLPIRTDPSDLQGIDKHTNEKMQAAQDDAKMTTFRRET